MKSREEIRFLALLSKTQDKAAKLKKGQNLNGHSNNDPIIIENSAESEEDHEWRLPKFVETLEEWLQTLEHHPQGPDKNVLVEYHAKVDFLKKVLECQPSATCKTQAGNNNIRDVVDVAGGTRRRSLRGNSPPAQIREVVKPIPVLPHGPASTGETIAKEIHHKVMGNHNEQARAALFGGSDDDFNIRKRNVPEMDNDLDFLLKAHHQAQEQVAEEMLSLTRTLKEQTLAAKDVIRKDTAVIEKANENADKNSTKLKTESDRLQEHTKFSCRCWIWLLIVVVTFTFIVMVWVMKLFRKRSDY